MKLILLVLGFLFSVTLASAQTIDWGTQIEDTKPAKQPEENSKTVNSLPGVRTEPLKARDTSANCGKNADPSKSRSIECANIPLSLFNGNEADNQ